MTTYHTAESVTEGHPDKVCDIISDALVDLFLSKDHEALVSVKALATKNLVLVGGEAAGDNCYNIDIEDTVRNVIREIGYDEEEYGFHYATVKIWDEIERHLINEKNKLKWHDQDLIGSRDQGIVFGYACNETPELLPLPIYLAHKLARGLSELRKNGLNYLKPDGKTQVTLEYENGNDGKAQKAQARRAKRAEAVVISTLHSPDVSKNDLEKDLKEKLIEPVLGDLIDHHTSIYINPTGRFIVGGPAIDTGLTGRKLIVDTYGDASKHGGGAFSGKDPTSSDRCGAYLARYIAKNVVAAGLAEQCEIELAYAIGSFAPLHLTLNTYGTGVNDDSNLQKIIEDFFDLTLTGAITNLQLRQPIYKQTACFGHFGRPEFPWEKTDKAEYLKRFAHLKSASKEVVKNV